MIQIRLQELAEAKGLNKSQLSLRAQVGLGVVRRYWDGNTASIDLSVLEKFCVALGCEPGDLIKRVQP